MENKIKEEAKKLIEKLAPDATWEDLRYLIYVRQAIEEGLADSEAGRVVSMGDIRKSYGLPE